MSVQSGYRSLYARVVFLYVLALLLFGLIINVLLYEEHKEVLLGQFSHHAGKKLELLDALIREPLMINDFSTVERTLLLWAEKNEDVSTLQAVTQSGFVLVDYQSVQKHETLFTIESTRIIEYGGVWSLRLELTESYPGLQALLQKELTQNIAITVAGIMLFGMLLWLIVQRLALGPLIRSIKEQDRLNQNLEKIVEEKTVSLKKLNSELEERVETEILQRLEQKELLLQQSKFAVMGEMLGAISHQLKQPLSVILLQAQSIQFDIEEGRELDKADKNLDVIIAQTRHMDETINHFKNFLKPVVKKVPFRACEMVGEVVSLIEAQLKNNEINVTIGAHEHFTVYGYPADVKHVILNIINNARDAFIERNIQTRNIQASFEVNDQYGVIRLRDSAGGIPEELLPEKLFEAYVTTKEEKGTGIGLNLSKSIVEERMSGRLSVHNIDGGAEFVIALPLNTPPE